MDLPEFRKQVAGRLVQVVSQKNMLGLSCDRLLLVAEHLEPLAEVRLCRYTVREGVDGEAGRAVELGDPVVKTGGRPSLYVDDVLQPPVDIRIAPFDLVGKEPGGFAAGPCSREQVIQIVN